ncbi:MAG: HAD family phosphatase [Prevotella sp.]|nr:HAD family phosphatase [Prevotella sp.]
MTIHNIIFDLGGVVITLDKNKAIRRFKAIGLDNAEQHLDAYTQQGIFGDVEKGIITPEEFQTKLGQLVNRPVTYEECCHAWQGYAGEVPQRNLKALEKLRNDGFRLILLSNTNPFMMEWAGSNRFDGMGHPVQYYFDAVYLSYELHMLKPDPLFFRKVLLSENILPENTLFIDDGPRNVAAASQLGIFTLCPENGADWTQAIFERLKTEKE